MVNLGALNWFDSFIKKLKKALDCINYVIYTPDVARNTKQNIHLESVYK